VADIYTVDIVEPLAKTAEATLQRLGYKNVHVKAGDGYKGWPEEAPFDAIIVTCAPEKVPQPLVDQLKDGGRMVIPVGERFAQQLYLFEKRNGQLKESATLPVRFVPMLREGQKK
jgi:protein-L-isoaspartate(D-aspartate) O-methyltransferase